MLRKHIYVIHFWELRASVPISTTSTPLKATHVHPGDCASCDQLESYAPGH